MATTKKATPTKKIDTHKEIIHPLDYSFKAVSDFSDILREKPRNRDSKAVLDLDEEELDSSVELLAHKSKSPALKLNNNMISKWEGFWETLSGLFVDPSKNLQWLDLSFNDLREIDKALLQLPNLTMLYLHGNNIRQAAEVDKLSSLCSLKSLTLHGNPIETLEGYRFYILSRLPQLMSIDFSGVTKQDRKSVEVWMRQATVKKSKSPKKKSS